MFFTAVWCNIYLSNFDLFSWLDLLPDASHLIISSLDRCALEFVTVSKQSIFRIQMCHNENKLLSEVSKYA